MTIRTVAGLLLCGLMSHAATGAQANPDTQAAPKFAFEVASIRQNTDIGGRNHIYSVSHNGEFRTVNAPLKMILEYAYNLPQTQMVGAPSWVDSTKFDIDAKSDPAVSDALAKMDNNAAGEKKREMVRGLLEERFGLVTHRETREMPVFDLVVAKGGPKFQKSDLPGTTINEGRDHIDAMGSDHTLAILCESLGKRTGRVVVDKTGLDGRYKIALKWTPDDVAAAGRTGPDAPPDLFTAIQEQLGLKLEPAKGAVPVLVIDKISMPTEN
ncbi:MAG TPA: TIGR03435 family protein [Acidobacteriaceae bacterium]|nr:TIGR03435 family protein [Acidobacteriaceae bacterium]